VSDGAAPMSKPAPENNVHRLVAVKLDEGSIGRGTPGFDEDSILARIQRTQFMAVS